jgi:hypothetical protein
MMGAHRRVWPSPRRPGDVLHVTLYGEHKCDMWVVMDECDGYGSDDASLLWGRDIAPNRDPHTRSLRIDDEDVYTIERDLPEKVVVELVKLRLTQ